MATYYIVNADTRALIRTSRTPFNVDEDIQPPAPYIQLKHVDGVRPAFDPATQKLVQNIVDDDVAHTRTYGWSIVALSQAELDALAQQAQDAATLIIIRNVYQDLRNGVGTAAERLQRLERAVAWLLRSFVS